MASSEHHLFTFRFSVPSTNFILLESSRNRVIIFYRDKIKRMSDKKYVKKGEPSNNAEETKNE